MNDDEVTQAGVKEPLAVKDTSIIFIFSFIAGMFIWALSPEIARHTEPWDSETLYYPLALLLAGLISGYLWPRKFRMHYLGIVSGQLAYMLIFISLDPLMIVGVGFLAVYSLLSLAGVMGGVRIRRLNNKPAKQSPK